MEHEVYVPFAAGAVRSALADPGRVARCVPGLQPDAPEGSPGGSPGASPGKGAVVDGRLRVRIGGSTITYRGSLRLTSRKRAGNEQQDQQDQQGQQEQYEEYTVRGEGTEVRGSGSARLTLTVVPRPADDGEGTVLVCRARVRGEGRITEFESRQWEAAGRRLLDRFAGELSGSLKAGPGAVSDESPESSVSGGTDGADVAEGTGETAGSVVPGGIGDPEDNEPAIPGIPAPDSPQSASPPAPPAASAEDDRTADAQAEAAAETVRNGDEGGEEGGEEGQAEGEARSGEIFGTEVPSSPLDPLSDEEFGDELGAEPQSVSAEAAHARRTMIGRSAEEVDHAPPRGRYAPVPAPPSTSPAVATLRWAAPAAALALASAVVVGRVLRRRR